MFFILPCHRRVQCVSCSSSASMILWFLKVVFLGSRLHFSEKFFAQNLKLIRPSNPRKYQIKTLTTAPMRRPVSCTKKRHFRILIGSKPFPLPSYLPFQTLYAYVFFITKLAKFIVSQEKLSWPPRVVQKSCDRVSFKNVSKEALKKVGVDGASLAL